MFVILIKKTLGSGFKYSAFHYCDAGKLTYIHKYADKLQKYHKEFGSKFTSKFPKFSIKFISKFFFKLISEQNKREENVSKVLLVFSNQFHEHS